MIPCTLSVARRAPLQQQALRTAPRRAVREWPEAHLPFECRALAEGVALSAAEEEFCASLSRAWSPAVKAQSVPLGKANDAPQLQASLCSGKQANR